MASATLRYIIQDIHTALQQNIDDAKITLAQVLFHTLTIADRLKLQHIEKRDSGVFLHIYDDVPVVKTDTGTNPDIIRNRHYLDLPASVYDMDKDRGISYISYVQFDDTCVPPFTFVQFSRTTPSQAQILYMTDEETPSPSNPYFYMVGTKAYLLGTECISLNKVEVGLYSSFNIDEYFSASCLLDEPFDFPPELITVLRREVLDLDRFILMVPRDLVNDGANELDDVPKSKLISVNPQQQ